MHDPVFSVVVPFYATSINDRRPLLTRAIAALPPCADIEVVVVDDASPLAWDPSMLPPLPFSVRVMPRVGEVKGAGAARNTGLDAARGEWIVFLDSDDRFDAVPFGEVLDTVRGAPQDCDMFLFGVRSETPDGAPAQRHVPFMRGVEAYVARGQDPLSLSRVHAPWGRVIRHSFLSARKVRFEEVSQADDVGFSVRVGVWARTQVLPQVAYVLLDNPTSITTAVGLGVERLRIGALFRANTFLAEAGFGRTTGFATLVYLKGVRDPGIRARLLLWSLAQPGAFLGLARAGRAVWRRCVRRRGEV